MTLILWLMFACTPASPPAPSPQAAPAPARPIKVELVYDNPVDVPALDAEVTLVAADKSMYVDPESGRRTEAWSGTLRFVDRDGEVTEQRWGRGQDGMAYGGHRLAMRGADLSWQLIVR